MNARSALWAAFALFVGCALYLNWHDGILALDGPLGFLKLVVWVAFLSFSGYTVYCSWRENFLRSVRQIASLHWGRQVGIDLYLGLSLMLLVVFLHERSVIALVLWLIPTYIFGNLATLLYVAIHFDALASRFLR